MPSPTPANVADAYAAMVRAKTTALAGKDGRLTGNEAKPDPFVADAYARAGKKKPVIESVASIARAAMLEEAKKVDGGDGRVSKADAAKMSPLFAQAFQVLRGGKVDAPAQEPSAESKALAAKLGQLADGLLFMSESDDPYTPFTVHLDPNTKVDAATLKNLLTWDAEEWDDFSEYDPYPVRFELQVDPHDDFWGDRQDLEPAEQAKHEALENEMKNSFIESTGADGRMGKIWSVTATEEDAARAPYYIFGRMQNGDLVGLKTWRTWT